MLILTRRLGEKIVIGDDITITILNFNGKFQVRIGIDAPDDVSVHREKIYQRIQAETEMLGEIAAPIRERRLTREKTVASGEGRPQITLKKAEV